MFTELAASLLTWAYQAFSPGVCPGDWVFATSAAGAFIAVGPVLGAVAIAVTRKFTANNYDHATIGVFAGIGALFVLLLPAIAFLGISSTYRDVFAGGSGGLDATQVANLDTSYCGFVGNQLAYLGGGPSVYDELVSPGQGATYWLALGGLVGLPLVALLVIMLMARVAFRRGPRWPGRLYWVPFAVLMIVTVGVSASTAMHLWLGFLPVALLGVIPVSLVGPPSWRVIRRRERAREPSREQPSQAQPSQEQPNQQRAYPPTALAAAPLGAPITRGGGRYQRLRKLGHGGFGTVWQARDTQLERTVALKIAHHPDADTTERMQREARALAAVNHPNCVRVFDLVAEHDGLALVMEYLEGTALAFAVDNEGPLADVQAARLWGAMAGALLAAHDKGVIHRDVKPSNVIIDPRGTAHLIDFGIARSRGDATITASGMMIGTPDYTPPEIANGQDASPASDAWQLAATVNYALTGEPPRGTRSSPMAALTAAARAEPPSELPRRSGHVRLLARSLDADPHKRPPLRVVADEVNGWLARVGESASGPVTRVLPQETRRE